jgi:hypothetical protein
MKTLLSLYLGLAVILAQFFAAYFFSKGRTSYRKAFAAMVLCVSVYLFGYLMIINNNNLQEMIFWNQIQYLGLPFISVLWAYGGSSLYKNHLLPKNPDGTFTIFRACNNFFYTAHQ